MDSLHGNKEYTTADRKNVPYSTFISPALSHVGLHKKKLKQLTSNVAVASLPVANMPRGAVNQDPRGLIPCNCR